MSVTAAFIADFSSFHAAVETATAKLRGFEGGTKEVERSLVSLTAGMTRAGQISGESARLIAGMSASGREAAAATSLAAGATGGFGSALKAINPLLGAFGVSLTIGAAVGFAKSVLADASALVRLSDSTAISIGALREMQRVGADANVSIETLSSGASFLQRTLAAGDQSTVAALTKLGLKFEDIRRMSPEQQYFTVAEALKNVSDHTTQAGLGAELMGRGFSAALPAIKQGFQDVNHTMDQTTKDLAALSDALGRFWKGVKDAGGAVIASGFNILRQQIYSTQDLIFKLSLGYVGSSGAADALTKANADLANILPNVGQAAKSLTLTETAQANIERQLGLQLKDTTTARKTETDAVKVATDAQKKWQDAVASATDRLTGGTLALHRYIAAIPGALSGTGKLSDEIRVLAARSLDLRNVLVAEMPSAYAVANTAMQGAQREVMALSDRITGHLTAALQGIPQIFIDAFTGGGGVIGALKGIGVSLLNAIVKEILDPLMATVSSYAVGIGKAILSAFTNGGGGWGGVLSAATNFGGASAGAAGGIGIGSGTGIIGGSGAAAGTAGGGAAGAGGVSAGAIAGGIALGVAGGALLFALTHMSGPGMNDVMGGTVDGKQLTIAEAIARHNQMTPAERQAEFERNNPGMSGGLLTDEALAAQESGGGSYETDAGHRPMEFASGTQGKYLDFGAGTHVRLHGKERVMTEQEGRGGGTVIVELDGRKVAEWLVPELAGAIARYGLGR